MHVSFTASIPQRQRLAAGYTLKKCPSPARLVTPCRSSIAMVRMAGSTIRSVDTLSGRRSVSRFTARSVTRNRRSSRIVVVHRVLCQLFTALANEVGQPNGASTPMLSQSRMSSSKTSSVHRKTGSETTMRSRRHSMRHTAVSLGCEDMSIPSVIIRRQPCLFDTSQ